EGAVAAAIPDGKVVGYGPPALRNPHAGSAARYVHGRHPIGGAAAGHGARPSEARPRFAFALVALVAGPIEARGRGGLELTLGTRASEDVVVVRRVLRRIG